jgi:hypothetical protein
MRDPTGRSLHDRDAGLQSETRQMGESDRRGAEEKALPYVLAVMILFVVVVVVIIATR